MFKFLHYVFRNMTRHKIRTTLTVFGTGVAIFITTYLASIHDSRAVISESASQTIVVVHERDVY